jgi:hypothetical protein
MGMTAFRLKLSFPILGGLGVGGKRFDGSGDRATRGMFGACTANSHKNPKVCVVLTEPSAVSVFVRVKLRTSACVVIGAYTPSNTLG